MNTRVSGVFAAALLLLAVPAVAQNHMPLEMLNIKPVGAPPTGMSQYSRIYRAYPALTYNIRAAVVGGNYPYTFTLSNAPSGMTVNQNTGEINWVNPQANASPTLTVRDQSGAQVSATWPITVATAGFRFIDATNGNDANAGTLAAPWRTVARAKAVSSLNDIWYFRSGVYLVQTTFGPLVNPGTSRYNAAFFSNQTSVIWLGYPGETPVIDYGYNGNATSGQFFPSVGLAGSTIYVDGFETRNTQHFFFLTGGESQGPTFRRMKMHGQGYGWIESESNASFLMYEHQAPQSYGAIIQDSELYDGDLAVKHYDLMKPLIADNVFHDLNNGIEEKAGITRFTVRGNRMYNIGGRTSAYNSAIGGNYNANTYEVSGEVCFNLVRMTDFSVDEAYYFRRDSPSPGIHTYRNTFVGSVAVVGIGASDGTFYVSNNVIVNNLNYNQYHVVMDGVSSPEKVIFSNNLVGFPSDNIVDASGNLTGSYAQYVGTRGYQLGTASSSLPPEAPRDLRIVR